MPSNTTAQTGAAPLSIGLLPAEAARIIELHNGEKVDIRGWDAARLTQLHWEQERLFAQDILQSVRGGERKRITAQAYTTVCSILEELSQPQAGEESSTVFSMGMDYRYTALVLELLRSLPEHLKSSPFFELGFSAGGLLKEVSEAGFGVAGLEVVDDLRDKAAAILPSECHHNLFVGDFLTCDMDELVGECGLAYWNDVFEHIHPDEIEDYIAKLYSLLAPGGKLVTITPNWHMRPSDVTNDFAPPRTEAIGFHLKEYKLDEVVTLLKGAGFTKVTTPSFISRGKIFHQSTLDLTGGKLLFEPLLEWMPYPVAVQCCRRFGLNLTIAHKSA